MVGSRADAPRALSITSSAGTIAQQADSPGTTRERRSGARIHAEGRLETYPGAEVTVGSEVAGRVVRLMLHEKDAVRAGAVVAELDASELRAARVEAQASLAETDATLRHLDAELARLRPLESTGVVARQGVDRLRYEREAALARRALGETTIQRLDASIAKTRIVAPLAGVVIGRHTNVGETISPGAPIVTIADLARVRIAAEVDEYDALSVGLGDRATITAEGSDRTWHGRVEEIPDVVTTRRVNPQDPGRPTDVRVLVAKVALDAPTNLKLGQRVEVEIEAGTPRTSAATTPAAKRRPPP
jgi:RND family efflux transporter MFP subunit